FVLAALWPAPASAAKKRLLDVTVNGLPVDVVTNLPAYDIGFESKPYKLCDGAGGCSDWPVSTAYYLPTIIAAAGASLERTARITVTRTNGTQFDLTPPDFDSTRGPGGQIDFPDGQAVVIDKGTSYSFLRPYRGDPLTDNNQGDFVQPGGPVPLKIAIT